MVATKPLRLPMMILLDLWELIWAKISQFSLRSQLKLGLVGLI